MHLQAESEFKEWRGSLRGIDIGPTGAERKVRGGEGGGGAPEAGVAFHAAAVVRLRRDHRIHRQPSNPQSPSEGCWGGGCRSVGGSPAQLCDGVGMDPGGSEMNSGREWGCGMVVMAESSHPPARRGPVQQLSSVPAPRDILTSGVLGSTLAPPPPDPQSTLKVVGGSGA